MPVPFEILGIDHVVIRAADPARLERFYRDVLGCALEKRQERIGLTQLRAGRSLIDILDASGTAARADAAAPGNMDHLCLRIEPFDDESIRKHLEAQGIEVEPVASRYGAEGEGPSLYFSDPEGHRVELKGPPAAS